VCVCVCVCEIVCICVRVCVCTCVSAWANTEAGKHQRARCIEQRTCPSFFGCNTCMICFIRSHVYVYDLFKRRPPARPDPKHFKNRTKKRGQKHFYIHVFAGTVMPEQLYKTLLRLLFSTPILAECCTHWPPKAQSFRNGLPLDKVLSDASGQAV